jgi:hypothetical protein
MPILPYESIYRIRIFQANNDFVHRVYLYRAL